MWRFSDKHLSIFTFQLSFSKNYLYAKIKVLFSGLDKYKIIFKDSLIFALFAHSSVIGESVPILKSNLDARDSTLTVVAFIDLFPIIGKPVLSGFTSQIFRLACCVRFNTIWCQERPLN